ncbi:hypothetical protein GHT06_022473 [Daphnia sinensis]|uniref:HTH CENPB-type domain-containing protein n=1 Tax=Daphnia sinensis TaxID=1820382 RepID=A0AAD5PLQ7_9CRUS|nr:hypothetical protein GHT06_022473 [Daphnia sinensis]
MADPAQQSQPLPPTAPKTRLGLSLSERIKVIEARQMGKSMRQLAAQFGCGKTQILNTLAQKERYIREWEVMGRNNPSIGARKRFRHTRNEQINRSVHEWYQQQAANGLRITGPMLQKQARHYAAHLGIINFAASNGWLANFRRFYNIISCSPHPRKRKLAAVLQPESNEEDADPQASTSKCQLDAEFVQVGCDEVLKRSPQLPSENLTEKDPLLEENQADMLSMRRIKSEPASEDEEQLNNCPSRDKYLEAPLGCSNRPQNLVMDKDSALRNSEESPQISTSKPKVTSTSTVNHRKRRLLHREHTERAPSPRDIGHSRIVEANQAFGMVEERRLPRLDPISPLKVYSAELQNLARAKGLLTVSMKDECGGEWLEIRQSIAFYRVPNHGYPTHLSRIVVDSSLQYYLEVLGHCVQKGSLIFKDASYSFNYNEAASILDDLSGGYTVCDGIELLSDRITDLHMKNVQELGHSENMYATLPDQRFRSIDCNIWIDSRIGSKCLACKLASSNFIANTPMDLRCPSVFNS